MPRALDPLRLAFLASLVAVGAGLSSPFTLYAGLCTAALACAAALFWLGRS